MKKKVIYREIRIFHFLLLVLGFLFMLTGCVMSLLVYALPYSYPVILIGAIVIIPVLVVLMVAEEKEEIKLRKKVRKSKR